MANLFITNNCNNNCNYCFVKDKLNKIENANVSLDDFRKIINWSFKDSKDNTMRILGGEPLLHPDLEKMVRYLIAKKIPQILIFTNGLLLDNYKHFEKYNNVKFVVNINSEKDLGTERFLKLRKNIEEYPNKEQICFSITIYDKEMDNTSILKLLSNFPERNVRIGVAVPSLEKSRKYSNPLDYYKALKTKYLDTIYSCLSNHQYINIDCNAIPPCLFTKEEIKYFENLGLDNVVYPRCYNVGDVNYNASCIPCSGFEELIESKNIFDYDSLIDLQKHLDSETDIILEGIKEKHLPKQCVDCDYLKNNKCNLMCKKFYADKIINETIY